MKKIYSFFVIGLLLALTTPSFTASTGRKIRKKIPTTQSKIRPTATPPTGSTTPPSPIRPSMMIITDSDEDGSPPPPALSREASRSQTPPPPQEDEDVPPPPAIEAEAELVPPPPPAEDNEPIMVAARQGLLRNELQGIMNSGSLVNYRDHQDRTPLMIAIAHGHEQTARDLIALGADRTAVDDNGHNAQWYAQQHCNALNQLFADLAGQPLAVPAAPMAPIIPQAPAAPMAPIAPVAPLAPRAPEPTPGAARSSNILAEIERRKAAPRRAEQPKVVAAPRAPFSAQEIQKRSAQLRKTTQQKAQFYENPLQKEIREFNKKTLTPLPPKQSAPKPGNALDEALKNAITKRGEAFAPHDEEENEDEWED